jgi:ankyrin repeat protein
LVKSGVVLNVNDIRRQNELHFAFMGNTNKEMIKFLLETGSRISLDGYESSVARGCCKKQSTGNSTTSTQ